MSYPPGHFSERYVTSTSNDNDDIVFHHVVISSVCPMSSRLPAVSMSTPEREQLKMELQQVNQQISQQTQIRSMEVMHAEQLQEQRLA